MLRSALSLALLAAVVSAIVVACSDGASSPGSIEVVDSGNAPEGGLDASVPDAEVAEVIDCDAGASDPGGCGYLNVTLSGGFTASDCCYGCGADVSGFSWMIDHDQVGFSINFPQGQTALWPTKTGATSIALGGTFTADLSGMTSVTGFTLFVVEARYGDGTPNCVLGSHTYPPINCPTTEGQAMQLCYGSNTTLEFESFCTGVVVNPAANTSSGYQANLTTAWFDPATPRYFTSLNGATAADNSGQSFPGTGPLTDLTNARLGGGYGGSPYTGLLGEVIVYSALLSTPDRTAVQSYLKTKWKTP